MKYKKIIEEFWTGFAVIVIFLAATKAFSGDSDIRPKKEIKFQSRQITPASELKFAGTSLKKINFSRQDTTVKNDVILTREDNNGVLFEIITEDIKIKENVLNVPGYGINARAGEPAVPVKGLFVAVPKGAKPEVRLIEKDFIEQGNVFIPFYRDSLLDGNLPVIMKHKAKSVFKPSGYYPVNIFEYEKFEKKDFDILKIRVFPVQYDPLKKAARIYKKLGFQVEFKLSENEKDFFSGRAIRGQKRYTGKKGDEIFINPSLARQLSGRIRSKFKSGDKPMMSPPDARNSCKILVDQDGMVRITAGELQEYGVSLGGIDPRTLCLYNKGKVIPIRVKGEDDGIFQAGDYIVFYGQHNRGIKSYYDEYEIRNTYWLTWGDSAGVRLMSEDGSLWETDTTKYENPGNFQYTEHVESNDVYGYLSQTWEAGLDHWFMKSIKAPSYGAVQFALPSPDTTTSKSAYLKIRLQGNTYPPEYPDHHVQLYLQGILTGNLFWDGQESIVYDCRKDSVNIPNNILKPSGNEIAMMLPGDTPAGIIDEVFLDYFEVTYYRNFRAENGRIFFCKPPGSYYGLYQFTLQGFSDGQIDIYKIGSSYLENFNVSFNKKEAEYTVKFQDIIDAPDTWYMAVDINGYVKPWEIIYKQERDDLLSPTNTADLVVVAAPEYTDLLEKYKSWQEKRGFRTKVVSTDDIYDAFNYGIYSGWAVKSFLKYAYENWLTPRISYVLFVGDGAWDTYRNSNYRSKHVPVVQVYTSDYGTTVSDFNYACLEGNDMIPEVMVGRFPVNSKNDLDEVLRKTISYEDDTEPGKWKNEILMIGGEGDYFRDETENLIEFSLEKNFFTKKLYVTGDPEINPDPFLGNGKDLIEAIDRGKVLINFEGHGGGAIWSDYDLLTLEDITLLQNGNLLPVIFSFTCITAAFGTPPRICLGERFLLEKTKGAVGFFGSTGLSYMVQGMKMNEYYLKAVSESHGLTVGEILKKSAIEYYRDNESYIAADMLHSYLYLGDPTLRISLPDTGLSVSTDPRIVGEGDNMNIIAKTTKMNSGQGVIAIVDPVGETIEEKTVVLSKGECSTSFFVTEDLRSGEWSVRGFFEGNDERSTVNGAVPFSLESPLFDEVSIEPKAPQETDSVYVKAKIDWGRIESAKISCIWDMNNSFYNPNEIQMIYDNVKDYYITDVPIPPQPPLANIFFIIKVESGGDSYKSPLYTFHVSRMVDLKIKSPYDVVITGRDPCVFKVALQNTGDVEVRAVEVRFQWLPIENSERKRKGSYQPFAPVDMDTVDFPASGAVYAEIPWTLPRGDYQVAVEVDPFNRIKELNEANNSNLSHPFKIFYDYHPVTPDKGSEGFVNTKDKNVEVSIPAGAVSGEKLLLLDRLSFYKPVDEQDFTTVFLKDGSDSAAYKIEFSDSSEVMEQGKQATIRFNARENEEEELKNLAIYRWDEQNEKWIYLGGKIDSSTVEVQTEKLGTFTLLNRLDTVSPSIEFNVQDQNFAIGGYVSNEPLICALLNDRNGIDLKEKKVEIFQNNEKLSETEYFLNKNPNCPNMVNMRYEPALEPGNYNLKVVVFDVHGNSGQGNISFTVRDDLAIIKAGNYPNPVKKSKTIFTFTLTSEADYVDLSIFTVSGKLIKKFTLDTNPEIKKVDYSEIEWDVKDQDGNSLANGVYYYQIKAERNGKEVKSINKLAILQ